MKTICFNEVLSGKHFPEAEIVTQSFLPVNLPNKFEIREVQKIIAMQQFAKYYK